LLPGFGGGPTTTATPVTTQISQFLARGPVDPNALYVLWAGANDLFVQLTAAGSGAISAADAQAGVVTAATDLTAQMARLRAAGARYIVVFNLPDIGRTPFGVG